MYGWIVYISNKDIMVGNLFAWITSRKQKVHKLVMLGLIILKSLKKFTNGPILVSHSSPGWTNGAEGLTAPIQHHWLGKAFPTLCMEMELLNAMEEN